MILIFDFYILHYSMAQTDTIEDLDSQLLAAGELREKKRSSSTEATEDKGGGFGSLRERVMQARQAMNLIEQAKEKLAEKVFSPIKQGSRRALQKAWFSFTTVIGAILGILYINLHVLLKWIFGEKLFCKLGDEWLPPQVTQAAGESGKVVTRSLGFVEIMVLIFIDTIIFIIVIAFVAMFVDEGTFKAMTGEANKNQPAPAVQQTK